MAAGCVPSCTGTIATKGANAGESAVGAGKGTSAKFSSNANTGGTCFGDSGGPIFVSGTTTLVAVVSFVTSSTCSGTTGAYRIDQADDLAFLDTFL